VIRSRNEKRMLGREQRASKMNGIFATSVQLSCYGFSFLTSRDSIPMMVLLSASPEVKEVLMVLSQSTKLIGQNPTYPI